MLYDIARICLFCEIVGTVTLLLPRDDVIWADLRGVVDSLRRTFVHKFCAPIVHYYDNYGLPFHFLLQPTSISSGWFLNTLAAASNCTFPVSSGYLDSCFFPLV